MSENVILRTEGLKKHFRIKGGRIVKAVDGVSIQVERGSTLGLVGESGCGKSTLGRTIIRIYDPTEGTVTLNGKDVSGRSSKRFRQELARSVQMIFQDPYACLNPRMTVTDLIAEGWDLNRELRLSAGELGVKVLDGNRIQFTTAKPCDYFVDMMTADSFAPVQAAAAGTFGEMYGTDVDKVVASGPFKLTEWTHQHSLVLEKNENYGDAENVKLEKLDVTITVDQNTILGMFQNGELSLLKVSNELLPQYAEDPTLETDSRLMVTFIEFNPKNEFLANKNIREALSIAFDRRVYAQQVMHNEHLAAYGLVPYGVKGLDGGDFREQNGNIVADASDPAEIERARQLLATGLEELGRTVEELQAGFTIQCLDSGKTQAQAIQNMWKTNLGVEMPVSVVDFNVLLPMLMEGTFDCVIGGGQDSNYRDPEGFMNFIYEEGKWDDPEYLALMEKVQTQTGDERIQTWMDIERLVLENFIYIPQVYSENNWVFQTNVRGVQIFTYGYEFDFKNVYIVK